MQKIYQTDIKATELTLSENCEVMNEGTWNVYQLHHDVISALLSVKCTEVMIDMKMISKGVFCFWVNISSV